MKNDAYYTPSDVIEQLVGSISAKMPASVADFAAGDGRLLDYGCRKWPNAAIVATDVDPDIVRQLRDSRAEWHVGKCDFLNVRSRNASTVLKGVGASVDIVLLNPPFSCKGGTLHAVNVFGESISASTALAFMLLALERLSANGEAAVIVPEGVLNRDKDEDARRVLAERFVLRTIQKLPRRAFSGCVATSRIVHLRRRKRRRNEDIECDCQANGTDCLRLIRGTIQMHRVPSVRRQRGFPLIHSTNLCDGMIAVNGLRVKRNIGRRLTGPSVVVPRVGVPMRTKICIYEGSAELLMSDCVINVECPSIERAREVQHSILGNWDEFSAMYSGTCAPYVTMRSFESFLRGRGFSVE